MTPEKIRAAAQILRVVYAPVLHAHEDDWRSAPDISERLADVLDRQADAIEDLIERDRLNQGLLSALPEYTALFALVEKIEEAHS